MITSVLKTEYPMDLDGAREVPRAQRLLESAALANTDHGSMDGPLSEPLPKHTRRLARF